MSILNHNDLIFYKQDGQIISGGYSLNSALLKNGISPMQTMNTLEQTKTGGTNKVQKVSEMFTNFAVPAGLYLMNPTNPTNPDKPKGHYDTHHTMLSDDIYDKLFKLVQPDETAKKYTKTKKHIKQQDKQNNKQRYTKKRK
jgi:hypothetical protein